MKFQVVVSENHPPLHLLKLCVIGFIAIVCGYANFGTEICNPMLKRQHDAKPKQGSGHG